MFMEEVSKSIAALMSEIITDDLTTFFILHIM